MYSGLNLSVCLASTAGRKRTFLFQVDIKFEIWTTQRGRKTCRRTVDNCNGRRTSETPSVDNGRLLGINGGRELSIIYKTNRYNLWNTKGFNTSIVYSMIGNNFMWYLNITEERSKYYQIFFASLFLLYKTLFFRSIEGC